MTIEAPAPVLPLLRTGEDVPDDVTYVPSTPATVLWGRLPGRDDVPVARIDPGDLVVVDTTSHEGLMDDQGGDPVVFFSRHGVDEGDVLEDAIAIARDVPRTEWDGPHVVTGPIAVDGARPGDLLAVTIEALEMRAPYGVVTTRHGRGVLVGDSRVDADHSAFCRVESDGTTGSMALHTDDPDGARATFPLAPFLGVIGVAADQPGRPHSTPPGRHGGNLDIALLTVGSTLFLPVQVDGALLAVGDPHFVQGDGEVALTALEAPLRATLRVEVVPAVDAAALRAVDGPFAVAQGLLVPTGLSENLELALRRCVSNAVSLLTSLVDIEPRQAYLYLSAAADFAVTQAVDIVKGVHGAIRLSDFPELRPGPMTDHVVRALERSALDAAATEAAR
uniref:Acetamidase/formamidase family protein n=1 Tax=Neobacillus citreus TaxID=2833578 RepID=A0A942SY74_9BACI